MTNLAPNTIYGWLGIGAIVGTALYHKSLGTLGLCVGFGIGIYLYFIVDDAATTSATTATS
jgi:hypothetical protein